MVQSSYQAKQAFLDLQPMAIYAEHNQDYSALGRLVLPTGVRPNHSPNEHIESCLLQMSPSRSRPTGTPCPLASPHTRVLAQHSTELL
ncbi:hypothetical protein R3I93_015525 [Phoxinus phoxinus]|uniref:Uncharacterized protein n=1 Tax=Phoxinus phoxinus TaxID=58324 RepID=A0AAN9CP76_9TELE